MGDRVREGVQSLAIRGTGHEAEAAGGVATGSAGLATKAIVVACIGGSAAAGVGGACVATGVVDLPGHDEGRPVAEKTVPESTTTTAPVETTTTEPAAPAEVPASEPTDTTIKPVEQVSKELYGGGASSGSSGSTSGSRDFAAPASSSTSSGSGGGGSSSGRENFGP